MKTVLKKVYYCDYCKKKRGLSASAMYLHERHCTANLDRNCRLCGEKRDYRKLYKELIEKAIIDKKLFALLDKEVKCPACILTLLRMKERKSDDYTTPFYPYKDKAKEFWAKRDAEDGAYY